MTEARKLWKIFSIAMRQKRNNMKNCALEMDLISHFNWGRRQRQGCEALNVTNDSAFTLFFLGFFGMENVAAEQQEKNRWSRSASWFRMALEIFSSFSSSVAGKNAWVNRKDYCCAHVAAINSLCHLKIAAIFSNIENIHFLNENEKGKLRLKRLRWG